LDHAANTDSYIRAKNWLCAEMNATQANVKRCTSNLWFTLSKKFHASEKIVAVRMGDFELAEVVAILSF
jgi:hypothetical protein